MQLSVIIPIYNEEETLEKILNKVLKQKNVDEVIAVDDGSKDKTPEILRRLAKKNKKLKVVTHKRNQGKGAAIKTGIKNISGKLTIIQDADLEYNPEEFEKLLAKSTKKNVVYGSRMMGKNPHAYARTYMGNLLLTSFCNLLFSTNLTDIYTCYKLVPRKKLQDIKINSTGFELEAEITAKLLSDKVEILEVPISYKPRTYEKGKKIKASDALKGVFTLIKIRFS